MAMMDPREFSRLSDACLDRIVAWAERFDPDEMDFATGDGVVTLEFAGGQRFVLNRQAGNHQMWLAAGVRAWHYDWDAERESWRDSRDGHELWSRVGEVVGEKLGRKVDAP